MQSKPDASWADTDIQEIAPSIRVTEQADPVFRIAFICSANQFRSVVAEGVCAHLLAGAEAETCSFGILDLPPTPPLQPAIEVAKKLHIDLAGHRSRHLEPDALANASLVVGFDRSHIAAAVVDGGAAPERTFLLTELVQLLLAAGAGTTVTGISPHDMIGRLESARGLSGYDEFEAIPDLTTASAAAQREIAVKIAELVACVTLAIFEAQDDARSAAFLVRLEKLKGARPTRGISLWGRSRTGRAGART